MYYVHPIVSSCTTWYCMYYVHPIVSSCTLWYCMYYVHPIVHIVKNIVNYRAMIRLFKEFVGGVGEPARLLYRYN